MTARADKARNTDHLTLAHHEVHVVEHSRSEVGELEGG